MRTKEAILQELATEQAKLDELERELSTVRNEFRSQRRSSLHLQIPKGQHDTHTVPQMIIHERIPHK
jgi:hypothetical protein